MSRIQWRTITPGGAGDRIGGDAHTLATACSDPAMMALLEAARRARKPILLLINDGYRDTRTHEALCAIAKVAGHAGVAPRFGALVATGTHRFDRASRFSFAAAALTDTGLSIDTVAWHDADADDDLVTVGRVRLNRRIAESRLLLPIGSVEPHYFAGVTGPHKTLTVGCMSRADIERNHALALSPASEQLRLEGNPVFDDLAATVDCVRTAGKTIAAIAEVVCGGRLIAAAGGDPILSVQRVLPIVRDVFLHAIDEPVDILHLHVPLPLGQNLYQADKALKNNHRAVRNGGGVILEAPCPEGIGPGAFLDLLRCAPDYAGALREIERRGYRLGDHKAVKLRHLTDPAYRDVHVAVVSEGLCRPGVSVPGVSLFADVDQAIAHLVGSIAPPIRTGLVVEDAGVVCVDVRRTDKD